MTARIPGASREADWQKVNDAMRKGLPKTAIEALGPIIQGALQEKAFGEAAKAIARRVVLEGNIQGNKPEEQITRLETEIKRVPPEMVPLLRVIQANWYWHYFQNNRWRFVRRTATAQAPGKDFTTWDLPRLFAEIDRVFSQALQAADRLRKMPVSDFGALLVKGSMPDRYRPTMYDFVVQEALKFYTSGEQAGAKAEDAYELSADSPALDNADKFMAWQRAFGVKSFPDSPIVKALDLFGQLLAFHEKDADPTAFADADLARLVFAHNTAFGEDKAARYKTALRAFVDRWVDHEVSSLALSYWASMVQDENDFVQARQLAQRGENAHRDSVGGRLCHDIIQRIEAKSVNVTTERVWNAPWPKINVHYRNLTRVHFRAVAWDWEDFLSRRHSRPEYLNDAERQELLGKKPVLEWSAQLPPTADFKPRMEPLPAPATLPPGFYFLLASHDPGFGDQNNQVFYTDVWVSNLALVVRPNSANGQVEGFVLEANSGEPIPNAEVMAWYLDNNGSRVAVPKADTDENGFFKIKPTQPRGLLLRARHNSQQVSSQDEYWVGRQAEATPGETAVFFTDRVLYRPGQTVQYKGIALRVDASQNNYTVLAGRKVTVVFADPNGKKIAETELQANDYGSFQGSFTAPRDRLTGRMRLYVTSGVSVGETWVSVEEYKRPKFQVTLEAPKTAPKLNDQVLLAGKAEAYTGAAIDGATVKWRVTREVRWPMWWRAWGGWRRPFQNPSQEMAHGTTSTGTDGAFKIQFLARPDPRVSEKDEASFSYAIHADVTDSAGETRSSERFINVGFTALHAVVSAEEWQTADQPVELTVRTTTLDGEPQVAEGVVKIYALKPPAAVQRPPLGGPELGVGEDANAGENRDLSNPAQWDLGEVIGEKGFTTAADGQSKMPVKLAMGVYRVRIETQDRFGKKVRAQLLLRVLDPSSSRLAIRLPHLLAAPKWQAEPGQEFLAVWGTGYDQGRAYVEIERRRKIIESYWTKPGVTQQQIRCAITEAWRGGFTLHVTQVRENRAYLDSQFVEVPWRNQDIEVKWEHFTSKLQPGQKETWTAVVTRSSTNQAARQEPPLRAVAEMVATLYDESMDQYQSHYWPGTFGFFYRDYSAFHQDFANRTKNFQHMLGNWASDWRDTTLRYREFPPDLVMNFRGYGFPQASRMRGVNTRTPNEEVALSMAAPMPAAPPMKEAAVDSMGMGGGLMAKGKVKSDTGAENRYALKDESPQSAAGKSGPSGTAVDLTQVKARKNLNETAFFFPQLLSDSNGVVRMTFTMPEALTSWRFLGFVHDQACRSGLLQGHAVTAKDLMVQPNPPRFLREGDTLEFAVKVSNQTAARQSGTVRLTLNYAANDQSADQDLGNPRTTQEFDLPAKESRTFFWRLKVPDGCGFLTYKAVGSTGQVSDGEEGYLPVLSRRIFITESFPLPIRGPATKKFEFTKLLKSGKSDTLRSMGLSVQAVSQPAWYAVMALPYLMEFPHECSEQTFNRFYANTLARFIANRDPKIRGIFNQWKGTPALDSPLEKNQDLKSVTIEETPWYRQAQNESQARRNVGLLFDENRLDSESERTLRKLAELQLPDGSWPWFPGGYGNDYITLYITTGFGRLRHLGVDLAVAPAIRSLKRLDTWMNDNYQRILKLPAPEDYVPSATDAFYLYGRSFFLRDQPVAGGQKPAIDFFLRQARKLWLQTGTRQTQGHLAVAFKRWGGESNAAAAQAIVRSLKERSVTSEEMGMFWRETELSWWWYRAPIETQALMIEAFDEVMGDAQAVEECRVWLLKQKQTQDWKTTKATADAIYALLLRGKDLLASSKLLEVVVGGIDVTPGAQPRVGGRPGSATQPGVEAGTGFYEYRFAGPEVKAKMGEITVKKLDPGVAWASVHWQYLEDISKVTPYEGTPLKLKKAIYLKTNTTKGPVLDLVKGPVKIGDELVVRLELRVDRDMEYIHLKDQRGSGVEPVNVLSQYRYQDGLAYYESTRDTASHFFIDYLPKGAYVFEYSTRIQHRGDYPTGVAEIQCMYAPEFNSHSESYLLHVR